MGKRCRRHVTYSIRPNHHLYIILNDPCIFDGSVHEQCILVNITSVTDAPYDATCILEAGDHDFITHKSFAYYSRARLDPAHHLVAAVKANNFIPNNPVSDELLNSVIEGLHKSKQTKKHIKDLKSPK